MLIGARLTCGLHTALQRLPGRLRCHRWPIRPYWYVSTFSGPGFICLSFLADVVAAVSLRMQTDEQNKSDFPKVTPERSFADYILGSLILHFFCVNYIN